MSERGAVPVEKVEEGVLEWLARNEPLSRPGLNTVESRFMRSVGEPARMDTEVARMKNPHMRVAPAEEFGIFAFEADVVLVELDEDGGCGELIGYPVGEGWVPVVFCLAGPVEQARERMETVVMELQGVADGNLVV